LLLTVGAAFVIGFIYMVVLRYLGGVVIWITIAAVILFTIAGGGLIW